jgi:hypothetical protein
VDLSKLNEQDLRALSAGDMSKLSEEGLRLIAGTPDQGPGREAMATRDPNEVDPVTGRTRGDMEAELAQSKKRPGWEDSLTRVGREGVRQTGRVGRDVAQGAMGLPALLLDAPLAAGTKLATGTAQFPFSKSLAQLDNPLIANQGKWEDRASVLTRALSGAATGMGAGGAISGSANPVVSGLGATLANPVGQTAATVGGAMGGQTVKEFGGGPVAQMVGSFVGGLAPGGVTSALRGVSPTQSAQTLLNKGVDLTPGQMNPGGKLDKIEGAWQSMPIIGTSYANARKNAERQAIESVIQDSVAPGGKITPSKDLNAVLDSANDTFGPAYDTVKGYPLVLQGGKPVIVNQGANVPLQTAVSRALSNRGIDASPSARTQASSWLANQLNRPMKDSGDLLRVRSEIRTRIRGIKDQGEEAQGKRALYEAAEEQVTNALESQLPKQATQELKGIDAQYAKFKVIEKAVAKAGDKEMTPFMLSQAVKGSTSEGDYARGGGLHRDTAKAMTETFTKSPETGARLPFIAAPFASAPIGIPAMLAHAGLTLTKPGRNFAAGGYQWQKNLAPYNPPVNPLAQNLAQILQGAQ